LKSLKAEVRKLKKGSPLGFLFNPEAPMKVFRPVLKKQKAKVRKLKIW